MGLHLWVWPLKRPGRPRLLQKADEVVERHSTVHASLGFGCCCHGALHIVCTKRTEARLGEGGMIVLVLASSFSGSPHRVTVSKASAASGWVDGAQNAVESNCIARQFCLFLCQRYDSSDCCRGRAAGNICFNRSCRLSMSIRMQEECATFSCDTNVQDACIYFDCIVQ